MAETKKTSSNVGQLVLSRVEEMCQVGFTMPKDYNYVNAVKATMLKMQEIKDKNGKPALEVCTPSSIQSALFSMVVKGLDVSKNQAYLVCYGEQLQLQESYFGKVLQVKRIFPDWEPRPNIVHESDTFKYKVNPETGRKELVEHTQSLENLDKPIVGGYIYLPCADGGKDLYCMTYKQIVAAWNKSRSGGATAKQFPEKMAMKTLVNSGCTMVINSTPSQSSFADNSDDPNAPEPVQDYADAEEVVEVHELPDAPQSVDTETGEIKDEPTTEEPAQAQTQNDDSDF